MSPCTWPHWCLLTVAPPFLMLHNPTPSMNPVMCAQTRTSSFASSSSSSSSSRGELELPRFIKPVQQWLTWDTGYYQDKKRPYWVDGSQEWGSDNKRGRLRQKAYWTIYTLRNIREQERLEDQSDGLFLKMNEMEYLSDSGAVIILMYAVISDSVIETSIRFESTKYFTPTHTILCFHVLECSSGLIWLQCFQRMTSILWCNPVRRVTVQSSSTLDEIAKDSFYQCHFVKHKTKHVLESLRGWMVIFYFFNTVWGKEKQIVRSWIWDAATLSNIWFTLNWWIFFFFWRGDFLGNVSPFPSYLHKHTLSGRYPRFSQSCVSI